jgi:hypothetical protein
MFLFYTLSLFPLSWTKKGLPCPVGRVSCLVLLRELVMDGTIWNAFYYLSLSHVLTLHLYNSKAYKTIGLFPVSIFLWWRACLYVCQGYNSNTVRKTSLNAPKSINISVGGSANLVAVFNKENHEIISMFLVGIEFMILVFCCSQNVYFMGP